MSICVDGKHCRCQPDDNNQPDSTRWCPNKIMAEWQKEYEQLRAKLAAAQKRIAELEGRTCENCYHEETCNKSMLIYSDDAEWAPVTGCAGAFEPKKED